MLRIANTGDLHLTEGARFDDTRACLEFVVEDGIAQGVGLWLIGGDLVGTTVPHRATILERNTLAALFQRMAAHAPVVIISGNHCSPGDIAIYGRLDGAHPIYAVERPQVVDVAGARVLAWPFAWKRDWLASAGGGGSEETDRGVEAAMRDVILAWRAEVDAAHAIGVPCVFLGHGMVRGSAIAGGEVMPPGTEVELVADDLLALGCDYYGISHVHLAQQIRDAIWLPGSPARSNFGETDPKGYLLADVEPGHAPIVHRRLTPARPFVTVNATWALDAGDGTPGWIMDALDSLDGAEVRVRVTVPEEAVATAPIEELVARIRGAGAVDVKPERRTVPKQELRCPAVVAARTLPDQLRAFWSSLPTPPDEAAQARALEKLAALERGEPASAREAA